MEPDRDLRATLVDLLDRVLDKGIIVNADIVISVAGVPLLGINLRAALAGMETMLNYGLLKDLDRSMRENARKEQKKDNPSLEEGETIILQTYGSCWIREGIYQAWRRGHLYLTNRRLLLIWKEPYETLLNIPLYRIRGLQSMRNTRLDGRYGEELHILLEEPEETAILHTRSPEEFKKALEDQMEETAHFNRVRLEKPAAALLLD
jgi:hypothetical protein